MVYFPCLLYGPRCHAVLKSAKEVDKTKNKEVNEKEKLYVVRY